MPHRDERNLNHDKIDNQISDDILNEVEGDMRRILDREPSGITEGAPHIQAIIRGEERDIDQPNKFRRTKRTITERERDIVDVANLYLRGMNHHQIAEYLSNNRPYTIKRVEVTYMVHEIYKRWQVSYLTDINRLKVKELAKIDKIESEYWEAWEQSKQDKLGIEQIKTEDQIPGQSNMKTSYKRTKTTTKKERRDPNFMFLQGVQWCVEQRAKIFGLNAPAQLNINWRKQAEEAGISDPEQYLDGITAEFVRAANESRPGRDEPRSQLLAAGSLPGSLGEGAEADQTTEER